MEDTTPSVIMPFSRKAQAACKKSAAKRVVFENGVLTVQDKLGTALHMEASAPVDGTYPDWRRSIPKIDTFDPSPKTYNARYLKDFQDAAKCLGRPEGVCLCPAEGNLPSLVSLSNDCFGLVMPIRGKRLLNAAPDWVGEGAQ